MTSSVEGPPGSGDLGDDAHPVLRAFERPDRIAAVMVSSRASVSYRELDVRSRRLARLLGEAVDVRLMVDGSVPGFDAYETVLAATSSAALADEPLGDTMSYSSGTTGRPKGIKRPLADRSATDRSGGLGRLIGSLFRLDTDTVYLSPAPLYHAAPMGFTTTVQATGGTTVIMERFDPVAALEAIETFAVTASQWVPTMFIRMLKLPDVDRRRCDLSSHRAAVHAAAPCPPEVKRQMMAW